MSTSLDTLRTVLRRLDRAVAFSAAPTRRSWPGSRTTPWVPTALAVTAVSPSLAGDERGDCAELAAEWGLRWQEVETDEMAGGLPPQRRRPLLLVQGRADGRPGAVAAAEEATVVLGVNVDDLGDHRPGQRRPPSGAPCSRSSRRASPRPTCACVVAAPGPAHVGQARGRLPGVAPALRHAGHARPAAAVERAEAALRRLGFARPAGAPLRRHGPHRGAARPAGRRGGSARGGGGGRARPPATAT